MTIAPQSDNRRMTIVPQTDNRRVKPDCEEIDKLIRNDPRGWSRDRTFKEAGLASGGRLFRLWETGKNMPFRSTLERLAAVLHGCEDVDQIIDHVPPLPLITLQGDFRQEYRALAVDTLLSREFIHAAYLVKGFENLDLAEFLHEKRRRDVSSLGLTLSQMEGENRVLARMGWLRRIRKIGGDRYVWREWHDRQIAAAFHNRVTAERNGILYAFFTSRNPDHERAKEEFQAIVERQLKTLQLLENATNELRSDPSIPKAIDVVHYDCQFHRGWGDGTQVRSPC